MTTTVNVQFERENKTFYPGETINGTVIVQSEDPKNLKLIKGTRVRCKGLSTVDLKFGLKAEESGASLAQIAFIEEDAKVLAHKLTNSSIRRGSRELLQYDYPFRYTLPKDLPSSFKTPSGKMEYFIKAFVPSGVAVSYFEGRGNFQVVGNLDLNTRPELVNPVEMAEEATVKTLITEGKVSFKIRLPRQGYAIGDKITLFQEISNNCKQAVNANISLIQRISYEFGALLRLDKENKLKSIGKTIPSHQTCSSEEEVLTVPSLPVTAEVKLREDKKVKIEYFLKYEILAKPLWLKKFKTYVPLVIGSVPYRSESLKQ